MIIRVTVNDNDFYYSIMGFMESMWNFREDKSLSVAERIEAHNKHFDMQALLNPNNDKKLTETEKTSIIAYLKEQFKKYVNAHPYIEKYTKGYLIENLEIKILNKFTDKWENGEAFYWFQHSNKIVNQ